MQCGYKAMADSRDSSNGRQLSRSGDEDEDDEDGGQLTKSSMEGSDGRYQMAEKDSAWIKDG